MIIPLTIFTDSKVINEYAEKVKHEPIVEAHPESPLHAATCDNCMIQIYGMRHKCKDCPDYDLCEICINQKDKVHPEHHFTKIEKPVLTFNDNEEVYARHYYDLLYHQRIMKKSWRQRAMFETDVVV